MINLITPIADKLTYTLFCDFVYKEYLHKTWDDTNLVSVLHDYFMKYSCRELETSRIHSILDAIDYTKLSNEVLLQFLVVCHVNRYSVTYNK